MGKEKKELIKKEKKYQHQKLIKLLNDLQNEKKIQRMQTTKWQIRQDIVVSSSKHIKAMLDT